MAWEHIITADAHDFSVFSATVNSASIIRSTAYKRTGAQSFRLWDSSISGSNVSAGLNVAAANTKYVAFAYAGNRSNHTSSHPVFQLREGSTVHVELRFDHLAGTLLIYRGAGTTLLGTMTGLLLLSMQFFDMKFVIHDTEGQVVIRDNNGNVLISLTDVDTRNGGTGVIDNLYFTAPRGVHSNGVIYLDDLAVRTDDYCGAGGNHVLAVTGEGADDDWTASAGESWECVDEIPASFTDYISTDVLVNATKGTFEVGNLPVTPETVDVVAVYAKAKLDAAGSGSIRAIVKSDTSYGNGGTEGLDTTEEWVKGFFAVDPDTSAAWDETSVNAMQPGVETVA
jgi:hypothetical protein